MSFGERLKAAREEIGYNKTKLAGLIGYGVSTVSEYERGTNKPNLDTFINLCKILDRDPNYFLQDYVGNIKVKLNPEDQQLVDKYNGLNKHDREIVDYILNMKAEEPAKIYRFPVYKQEAAAGIGVLNNSDNYDMEEYRVDNIPDNAVFAMKIKGNSMYNEETGHIKDKAIVLINPKDTDYENKIVIANLDGECVCKRYTTVEDHVEFKSDNEARQDENKDSRDYREPKIIGVVLGVIEDEKFIPVK